MTKWEYKIRAASLNIDLNAEQMNELGASGWLFCGQIKVEFGTIAEPYLETQNVYRRPATVQPELSPEETK